MDRAQVKVDGAGLVVSAVTIHAPTIDPLPVDYIDVTTHPNREEILGGRYRWTGTTFQAIPPSPPMTRPDATALTDRQLLERIARQLGLVR